MEYAQSLDFHHRPSSRLSTIDQKASTSLVDEFDLRDDQLESAMISPANTDDRRDSFGNTATTVFSPAPSLWEDYSTTGMQPERHFNGTANPFQEQSNNPFMRPDSASFGHHNAPWPPMFDQHSDSRTPIMPATYDHFSGDFEAAPSAAFPHVASASPAYGSMAPNVRPSSVFHSAPTPVSLPTSPPLTGKDYMSMIDQGDMDSRPFPKRMRQTSPPRNYSPFPRRDGIRKKNARFEIPPERSLQNIDQLIQESHDDLEIKELKQQKRLLRNRQAALDSRQRKKLRAEELETDNKKWQDRINLLEEELEKMQLAMNIHIQEKEHLMHERVQFQEKIQEVTWEKENMVQEHTLESGELRKRIGILTERLENSESTTTAQPPADYHDFTNEMGGLTMDTNEWELLVHDFCMDTENTKPQETSLVLAPKKKEVVVEDEKPIPSGLLMLLLLCGAWVATKSTSSSTPSIPLPPLSDDVRATSALVFNNIMKDAGVPTPASYGLEPAVSGAAHSKHMSFAGLGLSAAGAQSNDRIGAISHKLISTTKDQEAEAAFSLSAAQYNSYTSNDLPQRYASSSDGDVMTPEASHSSRRRGLADTLKAMADEAKGGSAVYTRSLLWDSIPSEIMQDFRRMVEESNTAAEVAGNGGVE